MALQFLSTPRAGILLAICAFALFSTHDVIIKQLGGSISAFQIIFFTSLFSFPLLTLNMISETRETTLRPRHPYWLALRCGAGLIAGACAFIAIGLLPLSEFYAYIFTSPLLITLLAIPILGEKVRIHRGIAIIVGLAGVLVVLRPGSTELGLGHAAALLAALMGSLVSVITRKIGRDERGVVMILYPMLTNLTVMALVLPFVYVPLELGTMGLLAVDAVLVLLAMALLVRAYVLADAMTVAPMQYTQIIWATVFGILLFQEFPEWQTYLGTAIIALSGLYVLLREARSGTSEHTPVLRTRTRSGLAVATRVSQTLRRKAKD